MQKNSQTIIVTNAQRFWVYYSAEQLAPKTYEIIRKRIPVVSARQLYEKKFPNDPSRWKTRTFIDLYNKPLEELMNTKDKKINKNLNLCKKFSFSKRADTITNLIIIGDSTNEMNAGVALHEELQYVQEDNISDRGSNLSLRTIDINNAAKDIT